jgi:N-acetyl-gamma-glutamyl-phosphate reductase
VIKRVAVAGASGYAGGELIRLLSGHPNFDVVTVTANASAGQPLASAHPHLASLKLTLQETTSEILSGHDVVFLALPHGASGSLGDEIDADFIVDCGADRRLESPDAWADYYGGPFNEPWTYGMPELGTQRERLRDTNRITVPGCNATAVTLGLAPLIEAGLIETEDLVSVLAVGTSGAGRAPFRDLLASEIHGSARAYQVGGVHRHNPEIRQNLEQLGGQPVSLTFVPALVPMSRGILATNTARLVPGVTASQVRLAIETAYTVEPFVHVLPVGVQPRTGDIVGSNGVLVQVDVDERAGRAVVVVALDNLGKGNAGAAIQSLNICLGFPEELGLTTIGIAP